MSNRRAAIKVFLAAPFMLLAAKLPAALPKKKPFSKVLPARAAKLVDFLEREYGLVFDREPRPPVSPDGGGFGRGCAVRPLKSTSRRNFAKDYHYGPGGSEAKIKVTDWEGWWLVSAEVDDRTPGFGVQTPAKGNLCVRIQRDVESMGHQLWSMAGTNWLPTYGRDGGFAGAYIAYVAVPPDGGSWPPHEMEI